MATPKPTPTAPPAAAKPAAAAPATPAPAPAPAPAATPPSAPADANPFAAVDAKAAPATPQATPKPAAPAATPTPPPADKVRPVIKEPKELRAELDRVNGEHKSLSQKLVAAEAKLAEAERKGQDTTALTSRITTLEGEIQKRDAELRAARQEASPEWKERFEKPFNEFAEYAKLQVEQLEVQDENGAVRQATWSDFVQLYALPLNKAVVVAQEKFGNGATLVMDQLNELHKLDWKKQTALKEEMDQYKSKNEKDVADRATQQAQRNKLWEDVNRDLTQSVDGYRDDPEDKELVDARAQAHQIIEAPVNDFRSYIIKQAHIKQRAAAYPVLMIKFARQAAKMDALQAELDSLKNPPPPGDTRRGGGAPAPAAPDGFEDYMRKGMSNVQ